MFVIALFAGGRFKSGPVKFLNTSSEWKPVRLPGDARLHPGAYVPNDAREAEAIRASMPTIPGYLIVEEVEAVDRPAAPPVDVTPASDTMHRMVEWALARGWDMGDLSDTGVGGDLGPDGGRSPITGLTFAEMQLTTAPRDWHELRAKHRPPWESPHWSKPALGWTPPGWRDVEEPAPPTDTKIGPTPIATEAARTEGEVEASDGAPENPSDKDAPLSDDKPVVVTGAKSAPPKDYPKEDWPDTVKVITELYAKRGEIPTFNACNYLLKKAGLKTVGAAHVDLALGVVRNAE